MCVCGFKREFMIKKYSKNLLVCLLVAFMFASCKVTNTYQTPSVNTGTLYRDVVTTDTTNLGSLPWTEMFPDTVLQGLIREGITQNIDLKIAFTRIQAAQAYYEQSRAAFYPTLDATASASLYKSSNPQISGATGTVKQYQLGLSSGWEAGIWGKLKSTRRANLASLLENESYARAVQTFLVANIANYYYSLLALDKQLEITEQTIQNWIATVQTMRDLKEAAVVTGAAVVQSEANRYALEVAMPDLKQRIRETENALSILLGRAPGRIRRSTIEDEEPITMLQTGVPAQLLSNRPDVQQAEYNFRYFFELTNVARTYFYPSLFITGSAGLSSLNLGSLLDVSSFIASIGGSLTQPIFNQRENKTRLTVSEAQQQEALLNFQKTLLLAGEEVSNALYFYQTASEKRKVRTYQLGALQKSVDYTQELVRYGSANYTEVLNAQQFLLSAELNSVNDKLDQLQAGVNLYRALGGGWK
jgi:outer membrane protein, multidrug efflux system